MRETAESRGYEAWHFQAAQTGASRLDDAAAIELLRDIFRAFATGAEAFVFDDTWIYDGATGPWMAYCGALSRRMTAHRYAGEISLGNGETAALFRDGASWFLPLWTEGPEREVSLPLQGAKDLLWTDALNNPLDPPTPDAPKVALGPRPRYLTGTNGDLLNMAALHQVSQIAKAFTRNARYQHYLPDALIHLVEAVGDDPQSGNARNRFFQIIRYLPELESQWHTGALPRTIAVPAIAHLARLARPLCALEEARAQPFLEPMHDTLLSCEEYQSLYLTGSVGTSLASERGDWLLREVQRLTEEARLLAEQDRPIEAGAVATLAEWRARALESAAKAGPLSDAAQELPIEDILVTQADTPAETEGETTEAPTSTETATEATAPASTDPPTPEVETARTLPVPPRENQADAALDPGQPQGTRKVTHTVQRGDTPGGIAKKYGVTLADFIKWNNLRANPIIRIGDTFTLYTQADGAAPTVSAPEAAEAAAPAPELEPGQPPGTKKVVHVVKRGDNPDAIAKSYGVDLADFLKWNKLQRNSIIQIGDKFVAYVPDNGR
jgi:LysM repeat protein